MRIVCAGGGSGGHVTPVVAVINELAKRQSSLEAMFVCDQAFEAQARGLMRENASVPVEVRVIAAGKFRRYRHLSMWRQLTMPGIVFANLRDAGKVLRGTFQSLRLLKNYKPDVVFAKGGYVCLPVGIAAKLLGVPLVVHDSDARPGLTNSILGRWAARIGTGSPLENYRYPKDRARYVGVPVAEAFRPFCTEDQVQAKHHLKAPREAPLVVVTGGGLGAASINEALVAIAPQLLAEGVSIYHVTGKAHYENVVKKSTKHENYQIVPFVFSDMAEVLGAADLVISRASATFIQELAAIGKPAVLVPSRALGDQQKNAEVYAAADAAVVLSDDDLEDRDKLAVTLIELIRDDDRRRALAAHLHAFARPDAAKDVAALIMEATE